MMDFDLAYSRPRETANALGEMAGDRYRFLSKSVLLTGEADVLLTSNGSSCFLNALRLLVRICPNVTLEIPASCSSLREAAFRLAPRITFGRDVTISDDRLDFSSFDAILSVGSDVHPEFAWTTVNSNGWIARVSSGTQKLSSNCDLFNPIAALAAACLGVGEVFKRLINLKPQRGELLNGLNFSLREYRQVDGEDCGPALPERIVSDVLVVGAGAIGNGLGLLLAQLPLSGKISIVDPQTYGTENLGTCVLIGPMDIGRKKADVVASLLRSSNKNVTEFCMSFEQFVEQSENVPDIVLNGLDNIDARHEVQRQSWSDVIIDGAISDFTCQVSRHPWPEDIACLICLYRKPHGGNSDEFQSESTGLSIEAIHFPDALVTALDVDRAPAEKRDFLRFRIGHSVCSVIQEGVAIAISSTKQQEGFQPSVPFVACFSASMVVAELVAHVCGWPSVAAPRYQFDFLMGPAYGQLLPQCRRVDCLCARRKNIDALRAMRTVAKTPDNQ